MNRTEAIEVIRKSWPVNRNGMLSDALETLIPELKESEDERIRKGLLKVFKPSQNGYWAGMKIKDIVAYLEKQREQQPAEWKPLPESMEALLLAIEGKWDAIKPTGYMSRRLEDLYDGLVNTFDVDEKYLSNLPKTEYTEKDIEEIKALKEKIDSSMETKPAEWSEEDEKMVLFWNMYYEYKVGDWPNKDVVEHLERFQEWLNNRFRSLRPQYHGDVTMTEAYKMGFEAGKASSWKPSEEQMKAPKGVPPIEAIQK